MESKGKIYEFNPIIYPFRLWVGMNVPKKDIANKFYAYKVGENEICDITEQNLEHSNTAATTFPVCDKEDNWIGAFVHIWRKDKCSVGVMAHEAVHVCDFLSDRLGLVGEIDNLFSHGEARAYFIEWVVNCINEVKLNKVKE